MRKKCYLCSLLLMLFAPVMNCWSKGILSYQHFGRLNDPAFEGASDNALGFQYKHDSKSSKYNSFAHLHAIYYPQNEATQASIPEAYLSRTRGGTSWTVGRRILDWTPHEKFWGNR